MNDAIAQDQSMLLDLVHEGIFVRDLDGRILFWNRACEALYGWRRDDALGQQAQVLLQSRHDAPLAAIEERLKASGIWEGEITRTTAAGEAVQIEARWSLLPAAAGQPQTVVETGRDITERKRTEEALRKSEHRYRNLFQAMAASFWELDFSQVGLMLQGMHAAGVTDFARHFRENPAVVRDMMRATRVIDVNDQTVALYGRGNKAELLQSVEPFWPEASSAVYAAAVVATLERKPYYVAETRLRRIDGSEFDALFTACFPPETMGKGTLLVGVIDISERKNVFADLERSELRYRNLFNSMGVSCFQMDSRGLNALFNELRDAGVTDLDAYIEQNPGFIATAMKASIVTEVNDRAMQLLGAKNRDDLLGPVTRYWPPDDHAAFRGSIVAGFNRKSGFEAEARQRTMDGRIVDVLFTMAAPPAMRDAGIVLCSMLDISARVRAEEALHRLQADFAHATRVSMLGELTASLAHEVNQPLAAIATNGEAGLRWLSRSEPDVAEVLTLTRRMVADARRAADIIARIRAMATRRTPETAAIAINDVIEEAMLFLRHEMQAQGVVLTLDLARDLPPVRGDRTQLQQVAVNLVLNAAQAMMQAQSSRRTIAVASRLSRPDTMLVSVEDSGPGITAAHREKLFESFFTTKDSGMGMGLPICRSIIEGHGGHIWADVPQAGAGARFCFSLPVADTAP